jgi:hypothetical protein
LFSHSVNLQQLMSQAASGSNHRRAINAYPVPKTFSCHSNVLVSVCHEAPSPALCSRILGPGSFNASPAGGVKCKVAKDDRVVSVVGGVTGRLWMIGARASLGALTLVMLTRIRMFWMGSGDR